MRLADVDLLKFGHTTQLAGAVYAGEGRLWLAMFPDEHGEVSDEASFTSKAYGPPFEINTLNMNLEEWVCFLEQTDTLATEVLARGADGTPAKAIVRKSQRQISQGVSWAVYRRADYKCEYCGADDVPLTVDHLVLWEQGGPSVEANLSSACRKCNKTRGNLEYAAWLQSPYYLKVSRRLDPRVRAENERRLTTLDGISRVQQQRSR